MLKLNLIFTLIGFYFASCNLNSGKQLIKEEVIKTFSKGELQSITTTKFDKSEKDLGFTLIYFDTPDTVIVKYIYEKNKLITIHDKTTSYNKQLTFKVTKWNKSGLPLEMIEKEELNTTNSYQYENDKRKRFENRNNGKLIYSRDYEWDDELLSKLSATLSLDDLTIDNQDSIFHYTSTFKYTSFYKSGEWSKRTNYFFEENILVDSTFEERQIVYYDKDE